MHSPAPLARAARLLLVAACCTATVSCAVADEADDLAAAIQMFQESKYLAAQEALLNLDVEALSDTEKTRRDEYLDRVQVALAMVEKATADLEEAETAVSAGKLDPAAEHAQAVLDNEYASASTRRGAADVLRRVADRRDAQEAVAPPKAAQEGDVAQPTGDVAVVEETTAVTQSDAPAAPDVMDTAGARSFTEQAYRMLDAGRVAEAGRLFERAIEAVPGYPEAVTGLELVASHEDVEAGPTSMIDRLRAADQINWKRAVARFRGAERQVHEFVLANRFEEARQAVLHARQIVESARQFADPVTKYQSLVSEVAGLTNYVEDQERRFNENAIGRQREEVARQRQDRLDEVRFKRQGQIDALMNQAFELKKDRELGAAIETLKQVVALDSANERARWLIIDWEDMYSLQRQREHREDSRREARDVLRGVGEAAIPWHGHEPRYPKDWPEIISSAHRASTGRERFSEQDLALHERLDKPIPVNFEDQSFEEVIDQLAQGQAVNITVIWNDVEMYGIDRDYPVTLRLPSAITFRAALEQILELVGGSEVELGYVVANGIIKIATKDLLDRNVITDVYDIRDLLMVIPDFRGSPEIDISETSGGGGGGGGGGGDSIFSGGGDDDDDGGDDQAREDRIVQLLDLIRNTIEPDSWRTNGGLVASIEEINGQLVVTQTGSAHAAVADLLSKLRDQQAIQVAVESRFITVQSNFLEELGMDLDIVLNNGNAMFDFVPNTLQGGGPVTDPNSGARLLLPRSFSRLGFTPAIPGVGNFMNQQISGQGQGGGTGRNMPQPFGSVGLVPTRGGSIAGATPVPLVSSILQITDPANLSGDLPGSFAGNQTLQPALNIFGSFLDNIQVDFLIRATQADARSTVLTAPRVVLFNGQRAWVAVVNEQAFVSELQPVVASGAAAQAPQTQVISTGAVLDVRATVSADRRYVTMTLRPAVGRLLDIQTFLFTTGPNVGAGASGFVQLPSISRQVVRTTVSVPDGGTLLIGGQKLAGEIEIEAGVPILSKIPILKRLYSSRTLVKDEQVLLILVKPRIIIQKEAEQRAFPTFSSR